MVKITQKNEDINNDIETSSIVTENKSEAKRGRPSKKEVFGQSNSLNNLDFDDEDFERAAREYVDFSERIHSHIPSHKLDPNYHYVWKTEDNARILLSTPSTFYEKVDIEGFETTLDAGYHNKKGNRAMQILLRCLAPYYKAIMKEQHVRNKEKLTPQTLKEQSRAIFNENKMGSGVANVDLKDEFFKFGVSQELMAYNNRNTLNIE